MPSLAVVRWILLGFGVVGLLSATVLFAPLIRRPLRAWLRFNERLTGAPVRLSGPLALLGNDRLLRLWHALWGIVFLIGWWYLGTPGGIARWAAFAPK